MGARRRKPSGGGVRRHARACPPRGRSPQGRGFGGGFTLPPMCANRDFFFARARYFFIFFIFFRRPMMCCKFAESLIKNSSKKCEMVQIPRQNGTNSPSKWYKFPVKIRRNGTNSPIFIGTKNNLCSSCSHRTGMIW